MGSLIQIAIVYQKELISILRDGKPYASYPAKNIDLLRSGNNFAVFGKRHMGGGGGIYGMIEDARIYDRALTLNEIKGLLPNEVSEIKPYAWWNFEDGASEETGRFPHHELRIGAKVENGKWVLTCISHRLGCRYFIGDFKDEQYLPEYHAVMGGNIRRYFAPESLQTPDGRQVN